jgi:hypothetical protein
MRYLRQWTYHGLDVGRFLVNAMPVAVFVLMIASQAEALVTHGTPDQTQTANAQIAQKEGIEHELLKKQPGQHVIFVSYAGLPSPHEEWVYNPANIDAAPVIWAWIWARPRTKSFAAITRVDPSGVLSPLIRRV